MKIDGKTQITGLFGYPVEHTLSPAMHNAAFESLNLNCCYLPFLVHPDNLSAAVDSVKALNMLGVNVTIPHKETVITFLDDVDDEALFIGAVNTIVNDNGSLMGFNTDGRGFMRSLTENHISIKDKTVLIVGTGGASRAISFYLSEDAYHLYLFDIDSNKQEKLVADLKKIRNNISGIETLDELDAYEVIINATPRGLKKNDPLPLKVESLSRRHIVCDLIYRKTPLLNYASEKGCKTLDGLGMLLWQGALAFELWTASPPPIHVMKKALLERLS